ncbi:pesticin C-terminus-like muramidase [Pseudomonas stutzeri]|uniref:pesticin C-terminus-like muramidase n=1 Tax=Stutzerimonas stutzeri TaxID=316 RepID=UPI00210C234C|nr:pesticin C-terminus-like muramidase [Stutzerimonas stutzeri]MCQ4312018.1 pesticin C-terminus-like muramidase [Stutzerimonas stutzeri]
MPDSVINWSYPFAGNAASPLANLTSLAKANGGHYPMGANGLWHGGVHFDKGTDTVFDQSSVRCIADGEVIAYRIDEQYPISEYTGDIPLIKRAPFSTGFVLVRHRLALPPLGKTSTSIAPALTFYSLYMHLQEWAGYQHRTTLPRPEFWADGTYRVETQGSSLNVRAEASQNAPILAALANGARVKIGANDGDFCKLLSIVSGSAVPALEPTGGEENLPGYLANKFLKAQYEPQTKDKVVVLDTPISIKAGALIGHLGQYQNQSEGMPQALLHLEVFSCEDVPAFIASSRAHAARLPDEQKTLLKIHKGASKLIPHRAGISANNPPNISDEGVTIGVDLILPQSLLDSLPADAKLVVPPSTGAMSGTPEIRWWRLDNLLADQDGKPISGWLAEQEMITTRHSPWEWEGYDFIENSERSAGALAYHLEALRRLTDDERANYQSMIDLSDKGPIKQRLHAILDGNGDRKITLEEIRTAISKPWHAQSIAQLITRHESEWFWNPGKWDELDELMDHSPTVPNLDWVEEKKRIEKLAWWKDVAGKYGIAADGVAWHFQPIGLLACVGTADDEDDIKWLNVPRGQLTFDVEGNDDDSSMYFSRVAHWPPVGASGVTIGRGYDVGHQHNVRSDLQTAGVSEPLLSWLDSGKGLKKELARDYLRNASAEIRSQKISRKQQHVLFLFVYESMEKDVKRICNKRDVIEAFGGTDWEALHPKIKDVLVDLRYRGDYTPSIRSEIQQHVANNDLLSFTRAIKNRAIWPTNLPNDRFIKRSNFLDE